MTDAVPESAVVVDTGVFSIVYVTASGLQYDELRDRLTGSIPLIATETEAELRSWPRLRDWGANRTRKLSEILNATATVPITAEVVEAYVRLRVDCKLNGHALGQKIHTGDRWVAATAIALGRPLISLDRIYQGAPELTLR